MDVQLFGITQFFQLICSSLFKEYTMATHFVRDYIMQNVTSGNRQYTASYILAIFLRRILGYTYVGDTNFGINSVGSLLIATADSTPTAATPTFAAGTKAGINQGTGREFYVWVPPSVRTVQLADVGRLLVLKSTTNPSFNSGVYLITGFESLTYTVQSTSAAASNPTTITTTTNHSLTTGQTVTLSGVTGNTAANGTWTVTVTGSNTFTIPVTSSGTGSAGSVVANSYIIDFRTMGDFPKQEAFDSLNWYLYAAESACPTAGAVNGTWPTTYGGNGTSTTPRIILQSPHALGWQVRICNETTFDWGRNIGQTNGATASVPCCTASPGFGGTPAGDFAVGGPHLHTALFYSGTYDANAYGALSYIGGATPGYSDPATHEILYYGATSYATIIYRLTIVGDDTGQGVAMFGRRQFNASGPRSWWAAFGVPENEPLPVPVNNAARLFVLGSGAPCSSNNDFGNGLNNIGFSPGYPFNNSFGAGETHNNTLQGVSQSLGGIPCSCVPSVWTYGTGSGNFGGPAFDGSAADSPFSSGTELNPVDLIVGTFPNWNGNSAVTSTFLPYEPRIIGSIPHVRCGRANFDEYATTNDANRAYQHMRNGIFIVWNGPLVVP
jgi:hypothetical protein